MSEDFGSGIFKLLTLSTIIIFHHINKGYIVILLVNLEKIHKKGLFWGDRRKSWIIEKEDFCIRTCYPGGVADD